MIILFTIIWFVAFTTQVFFLVYLFMEDYEPPKVQHFEYYDKGERLDIWKSKTAKVWQ